MSKIDWSAAREATLSVILCLIIIAIALLPAVLSFVYNVCWMIVYVIFIFIFAICEAWREKYIKIEEANIIKQIKSQNK
jgi:c-di-AMP phosphodiesterase-like protein